ncbi:methyltransferase domain-containing protein [Chryseolinea sp. T2]|uniref:methyltransferase domain-containing protein n=1 Tax=Chryseolinea sp. T2 TaxID=3129255 RepID=UPI00307711CB
MPTFAKRSTESEIMDDLQYAGSMMDQTLKELEVINTWLGGNDVTLQALGRLVEGRPGKDLDIADLGCGRGDMLRHIQRWSRRRKIGASLTGIDANPYIIEAARKNLNDPTVKLKAINILSKEFEGLHYDIVIGTLFYHHFTDEELISFFSRLRNQCRIGFIINDIHRHPLAYYSIKVLTQMFSKSDMVKFDAPLSVRRAFKRSELENILIRAGCTQYSLRWRWAFRWQICVFTS